MFIAKVTGSVTATQKVDTMVGHKLMVVEPYRLDADHRDRLTSTGRTFVAVDTLGAGEGEFVLIVQGSSARLTPETKALPVDTMIIGIVDSVHVDGNRVFGGGESEPPVKKTPVKKAPRKQTYGRPKTTGHDESAPDKK